MNLKSQVLLAPASLSLDLGDRAPAPSGSHEQLTRGHASFSIAYPGRILERKPAPPAATAGFSRFARAWLAILALLLGLGVCRSAHAQLDPVCPGPSLTITTSTPSTIYVTGASVSSLLPHTRTRAALTRNSPRRRRAQ
jgi:hypothetical protein